MSGFAALLGRDHVADEATVRRMLGESPHRGDDLSVRRHGRFVVGVSNPTEPGSWREASLAGDEGLVVAVHGVVDNLADVASVVGAPLTADSPAADIVLRAFRAVGAALPQRLRGVFAVVISDGTRVWGFRDHIGLRPLFYRDDPHVVTLASEAKQVVVGAGIPREPDLDAIGQIFYRSFDNDTGCALKGVRRLPKATLLTADAAGLHTRPYFDPEAHFETARLSPDEVRSRFDELMTQACSRALTGAGDVISISGGIDSPTIAAYAAPEHVRRFDRPIEALGTVYPQQPSVDESEFMTLVCERLAIPLHTYERSARPLEGTTDWVRLLDGPIPRLFLNDAADHYRTARSLGFRNMLTGEVAEFLVDMRRFLVSHLLLHGRWRALGAHLASQRSEGASLGALARQLYTAAAPRWFEAAYRARKGAYPGVRYPAWMDGRRVDEAVGKFATSPSRRWREEQLVTWMGPGLTMEAEEVCQSAFALRTRRPWADVDLWTFFLSLPAETKIPPNQIRKSFVRELVRGKVPDPILDRRRKTVFNESISARIDYPDLRKWLVDPPHRLAGIDYRLLAEVLEREELSLEDYLWANDLAVTHAFLSLW